MNKILVSLLMIGAVLAIAGAGTWAYFSDTEMSEGNTFTAGTLDLEVNGAEGDAVGHYTESNWRPGETRSNDVSFQNTGSLSGNLNIKVVGITGIADTCDLEFCNHVANLGGANFTVVINNGTAVYTGLMSNIPVDGVNVGVLNAGASNIVNLQATLNSDVGNEAQGDGIKFDIVATLSQV